jgi:hypothetical protein
MGSPGRAPNRRYGRYDAAHAKPLCRAHESWRSMQVDQVEPTVFRGRVFSWSDRHRLGAGCAPPPRPVPLPMPVASRSQAACSPQARFPLSHNPLPWPPWMFQLRQPGIILRGPLAEGTLGSTGGNSHRSVGASLGDADAGCYGRGSASSASRTPRGRGWFAEGLAGLPCSG